MKDFRINIQIFALSIAFVLFTSSLFSQQHKGHELESFVEKELLHSLAQFKYFLSIPNDAHHPDQIKLNNKWLKTAFTDLGFEITELTSDGNPCLFAERKTAEAKKTVLFYIHIDGQPVDSSKWDQNNPYQPVIKRRNSTGGWEQSDWPETLADFNPEERIFSRSTSDDKSPVVMLLTAIKIIEQQKLETSCNIKVFLDSEEEIGSPYMAKIIAENKKRLAADMMIVLDGPRHYSNKPSLYFGCRGLAHMEIVVYGPRNAQHSGHYGNYAPNPASRLASLLASMKDEDGRVTIPGFYDNVKLTNETLAILKEIPDKADEIHQKLGIAIADKVGANYQESLQYSSLNIHGMVSGWVGHEARTIVPSQAMASIDIRLVTEDKASYMQEIIRKHILEQGYYISDGKPSEDERMKYGKIASISYGSENKPFRTDFNSEVGIWTTQALKNAFGELPIRGRLLGGTVPVSRFTNQLGLETIILPLVNMDNNQHGPNENIRLGNYKEGIQSLLSLLITPIQ